MPVVAAIVPQFRIYGIVLGDAPPRFIATPIIAVEIHDDGKYHPVTLSDIGTFDRLVVCTWDIAEDERRLRQIALRMWRSRRGHTSSKEVL